jgi:uncharacterized protein YjbI with pentapeptide repeats
LASRESLRGISLIRADLSDIALPGADLTNSNLRMADLSRSDLRDVKLGGSHLSGATLTKANLVGASLVEASMIGVTLKGADLSRADISGADLTGANLDEARLAGAYLVGAYLNEASFGRADLSGAFVRMAQLTGGNLAAAQLERADLSQANLSGTRLDGAVLVGANLSGAILVGSYLAGCDLRGANLAGADLNGCNLTGAKLSGISFEGVKLHDAWAEWVDISQEGSGAQRVSLEEAFAEIMGKPMAQILLEGQVADEVWAELISHLSEFQMSHPPYRDVRLRGIQQGFSASVLYLEADREISLAAYLAEMADIIGKGSLELFERLGATVPNGAGGFHEAGVPVGTLQDGTPAICVTEGRLPPQAGHSAVDLESAPGLRSNILDRNRSALSRVEALQRTDFWQCEKAFAILTGDRRVWFEATSSDQLTLRPPHGITSGIDLIRGHFVSANGAAGSSHNGPAFKKED